MEQQALASIASKCPACQSQAKRFGYHRNGLRRFRCLSCRKTFTEPHKAAFRVADYLNEQRGRAAIQLLVEGCSVRTVERATGLHRDTIIELLVIAGKRCEAIMDRIANVKCREVQADEIWGFIACKEKNKPEDEAEDSERGDCYTWVAMERYSKLVLAFVVGRRTLPNAMELMSKVRRATSPARFQLTTDGLNSYIAAVDEFLSDRCDYAQLVKVYAQETPEDARRYSPAECCGAEKVIISGNPDLSKVCTSHIERQNLTMRMRIRRLTRLTNAFSRKLENHRAAIALHFAYYNFCLIHGSLRVTPAMEAGITDRVWEIAELLA